MAGVRAQRNLAPASGGNKWLAKPQATMTRKTMLAILGVLILALIWLGYIQPGLLLEFANLRYCG